VGIRKSAFNGRGAEGAEIIAQEEESELRSDDRLKPAHTDNEASTRHEGVPEREALKRDLKSARSSVCAPSR
jgi:hypothetical protein